MKTTLPIFFAAMALAAPLFAEPEYLPLKTGNSWTYRERLSQGTLSIRVGLPALFDNKTYYRLTGYVTEPLWVRFHDDGALYYRDEENSRDLLLTSFEPFEGGWFNAPFRICEQEGQGQIKRGAWAQFPSTLTIVYRTIGCADAGDLREQFAANIGMVQRTVNTFGGPRDYDLVSAQIAGILFQADPGADFSVSAVPTPAQNSLLVNLQLTGRDGQPVTLHSLTAQEIEVTLRGPDGSALWRWSDGKVFAVLVRDVSTAFRTWTVEAPLTDKSGNALPPGAYELEAQVLSGYEKPQFAGAAPVIIGPDGAVASSRLSLVKRKR